MEDPRSVPGSLVRDAIAVVAPSGTLLPHNQAMSDRLAGSGSGIPTLDVFDLTPEEREDLDAGRSVVVLDRARWVEMVLRDVEGERWLVVRDVDERERLHVVERQSQRARHMAAGVAHLVHDLNNQFASLLSLSVEIAFDPMATAEQQEQRKSAEASVKVGSRLLGLLSLLLRPSSPRRELVDLGEVLHDAVALCRKPFALAERSLTVDEPVDATVVRAESVDALEAVYAGLLALAEVDATRVHAAVCSGAAAERGGRPQVGIRLSAEFRADVDAARAQQQLQAVSLEEGQCPDVSTAGPASAGPYARLALGALSQRRLGGDLQVVCTREGVDLVYSWPRVVRGRADQTS
ncbi:MAG: hypothetical protein AB8H80_11060 [Planctomycetota bacterium]